ncbi:MAG: HEAT repeat domain-containing protein [Leptospira bouyouniensis]|uniref:HEAT repeat domain-containing protein n=1 Tax=Leptospira bouyouniensis TaxID=2484911 RepID=A0A7I0HNJ4_9LEPT|nr:HEAT repeat domain-containing protein [Leptospira bouyouniensis]TGL03242.1 HEAT repeat domain-containing protein [Leptospira bouyouniensis]
MKFQSVLLLFVLLNASLFSEQEDIFFETQRKRLNSSDLFEIRDAIDRLTFIKSNKGLRDILSALEGNPNFPTSENNAPAVKFYAAKALSKKGDSIAIPVLIKVFQKESGSIVEYNPPKQRKITDGVADRYSNSSPYFYEDGEISMVLACGEILRALGSLPHTETSGSTLKQALSHPNFYIRSSAADAMYESNRKEYLTNLAETLGKELIPYTKISILAAIVGIERLPNQNFKSVTEMLSDKDPEVRKKASVGLRRIDLRIAAPYLEKAIEIENHPVVLTQMKEDYNFLISFRNP